MAGNFPGNPVIRTAPVGGLDGVTGANQLDALVVPDGRTAAILPGRRVNAWLVSDSRVHFSPTRWVPLMIGRNSGVLVVRMPTGTAPNLEPARHGPRCAWRRISPRAMTLPRCWRWHRWACPWSRCSACAIARRRKTRMFLAGELDAVCSAGEVCRRILRR